MSKRESSRATRDEFLIRVCPVFRVHQCMTARAEQARGLMGFHNSDRCPACKVIPEKFELWGCNGHLQGSVSVNDDLNKVLEYRAKTRNERFEAGGSIRYLGNYTMSVGPVYGTGPMPVGWVIYDPHRTERHWNLARGWSMYYNASVFSDANKEFIGDRIPTGSIWLPKV